MKDTTKQEPKPRNPESFIEVSENLFEGESGTLLTLDELQNLPGQFSTKPLSIVFDSVEEAGLYFTTPKGTAPFVRETLIGQTNCFYASIYTLSGLSVAEVRKLIQTTN